MPFVTFEGIDGCGKSSQLTRAAEWLSLKGVPFVATREPGGTAIAEAVRGVILDPAHAEMCDACEVLLYLAARAQHVQEKILPALEAGTVVLCDRFSAATLAYQGYGRGYSTEALERMNKFATAGLVPDITFVFDLPVKTAFARMQRIGKAPDRLEQNSQAFYERVRDGYLALASLDPEHTVVIAGDGQIDDVTREVTRRLGDLLSG